MADLEKLEKFRESSKSWELRRGRSANTSEISHKNVETKYKEAFRNLSHEIKKRLNKGKESQECNTEDFKKYMERAE